MWHQFHRHVYLQVYWSVQTFLRLFRLSHHLEVVIHHINPTYFNPSTPQWFSMLHLFAPIEKVPVVICSHIDQCPWEYTSQLPHLISTGPSACTVQIGSISVCTVLVYVLASIHRVAWQFVPNCHTIKLRSPATILLHVYTSGKF